MPTPFAVGKICSPVSSKPGSRSFACMAHSASTGILALPGICERLAEARKFTFAFFCVCICVWYDIKTSTKDYNFKINESVDYLILSIP